ncbi:MAG: DUF523 domain-containing protein [Christensenellales bacterium]|jgi:uncharacterized protein YbbK (DUF523 family)
MLIVSACLAGCQCRYDGNHKADARMMELVQKGLAIPVCPEQLGGLSTPRSPSEIPDGTGADVISGKARVLTKDGRDVTEPFIKGAQETLRICKLAGATKAILKANSPSCGSGVIYDGTFSGKKKEGDGVTAALLRENGIQVLSEEEHHEG